MAKTQNEMQQRIQKLRAQIVGEIAKVSTESHARRAARCCTTRAALVYADPAYDITSEVLAEVAKSKGAPAASK